MKYFLQLCTLFLALSTVTAQCTEIAAPTSLKDTIAQAITTSFNDGSLVFGAVLCFAAALLIHGRLVKPPLVTPELYPQLFTLDDSPSEQMIQNSVMPTVVQPENSRENEKQSAPTTNSLDQYTDSDIAYWASVNTNFEQPF